jgi:hypothetical protein
VSVLLGQASGFEGFVSVEVLLAAHNLASVRRRTTSTFSCDIARRLSRKATLGRALRVCRECPFRVVASVAAVRSNRPLGRTHERLVAARRASASRG